MIMIKLAGRSPRLVRRWRDLGLLSGFSMLNHRPSPHQADGRYRFDGFDDGPSPYPHQIELWANDLGCGSLSDFVAGINGQLPDLGIEQVIDALPRNYSTRQLALVLYGAGISLLAIGRALCSWRSPLPIIGRGEVDRLSRDWLRWEIFKARWLEHQPATALLRLPSPDRYGQHEPDAHPFQLPDCPDQQVEYAQSVLASYLLVDAITRQAVRIARQRHIALIVLIEPQRVRDAQR